MWTRMNSAEVNQALIYFCDLLDIDPESIDLMPLSHRDQCGGYASIDDDGIVLIEIKKTLGRKWFIRFLAHELIHAKQYLTGRLFYDLAIDAFIFDGQIIMAEYMDCPFEKEAYALDYRLAAVYFRKFGI